MAARRKVPLKAHVAIAGALIIGGSFPATAAATPGFTPATLPATVTSPDPVPPEPVAPATPTELTPADPTTASTQAPAPQPTYVAPAPTRTSTPTRTAQVPRQNQTTRDPATGFQIDPSTGWAIHPRTGLLIRPSDGRLIQRGTGAISDYYYDRNERLVKSALVPSTSAAQPTSSSPLTQLQQPGNPLNFPSTSAEFNQDGTQKPSSEPESSDSTASSPSSPVIGSLMPPAVPSNASLETESQSAYAEPSDVTAGSPTNSVPTIKVEKEASGAQTNQVSSQIIINFIVSLAVIGIGVWYSRKVLRLRNFNRSKE